MARQRSLWYRLSIGWYCSHRRMRKRPCSECVRHGTEARCSLIQCPTCGLHVDLEHVS